MFISNGTTFKNNSKAKLIGLISNMHGVDGELNEEEWIKHGMPNGTALFEGTKDSFLYHSICLMEEFVYEL